MNRSNLGSIASARHGWRPPLECQSRMRLPFAKGVIARIPVIGH